jgi:rubredoxin
MSWIKCADCKFMFQTKNGREWRDKGGRITCPECLVIEKEDGWPSRRYDDPETKEGNES